MSEHDVDPKSWATQRIETLERRLDASATTVALKNAEIKKLRLENDLFVQEQETQEKEITELKGREKKSYGAGYLRGKAVGAGS
jgi:hypothetical protein